MGLTVGPAVLGGVFFLVRHGSIMKDRFVIETYLHQAAGALKRFGEEDLLLPGA
ncbi:MAG: hypothetical protein GKC04_04175 [Methanomicrobiales archaeon]|nr:hypothetical protein [Methanomicrobiales archaeon]